MQFGVQPTEFLQVLETRDGHGPGQFRPVGWFDEVGAGPNLAGPCHQVRILMGREQNDRTGTFLLDLSGRLQTVHIRHHNIHQNDVGPEGLRQLHRLSPVRRSADHLMSPNLQLVLNHIADQGLIVNDQYSEWLVCIHRLSVLRLATYVRLVASVLMHRVVTAPFSLASDTVPRRVSTINCRISCIPTLPPFPHNTSGG